MTYSKWYTTFILFPISLVVLIKYRLKILLKVKSFEVALFIFCSVRSTSPILFLICERKLNKCKPATQLLVNSKYRVVFYADSFRVKNLLKFPIAFPTESEKINSSNVTLQLDQTLTARLIADVAIK